MRQGLLLALVFIPNLLYIPLHQLLRMAEEAMKALSHSNVKNIKMHARQRYTDRWLEHVRRYQRLRWYHPSAGA